MNNSKYSHKSVPSSRPSSFNKLFWNLDKTNRIQSFRKFYPRNFKKICIKPDLDVWIKLRVLMSKQNSFSFLRRLNWSFPPNFDQNNSESRTISCFLQHLKSVQELTQVYSYQSKFEDAENFKGIKNMKQLKKLKLDFWSQTDLSDEELQQLFRIVRGLNKLESFSLDLSRCLKLTPKSMKIIHHSILSLAKLQVYLLL